MIDPVWLDLPRSKREAVGARSGRWKSRGTRGRGVVWHTTGGGPVRRHLKNPNRWEDPFAAAVWLYTRAMTAGPHVVVCGETGRAVQIAGADKVAWSVGRRKGWRYFRKGFEAPRWWRERWPELDSPTELVGGSGWLGGQANPNLFAVEVVPRIGDVQGGWTPRAWDTIRHISEDADRKFGIPNDRGFHVGHGDIHPLSRTRRGQVWDPTPAQWTPDGHLKWTT